MTDVLIYLLELNGTIAFAASGAILGVGKRMDVFGVAMLGLCTAVGGGVIRDLVLGITPPTTFRDPSYALVAIVTAVVVFLPVVRRALHRHERAYELGMLWMDSIGLGVFTVAGVQTACRVGQGDNLFLLIFVGIITGVGGGILRDVMAGLMPYVFVRHFYACASLIGALACALLWPWIGDLAAMTVGAVLVIVLRMAAAHYHWSLPKGDPEG